MFARSAPVFAVALLVGTAAAQTFDYQTHALPVWRLTEELGAVIGEELEAASHVQNDVLSVRFTDASAAEVMKRIAEAVDGEWNSLPDGGYRLNRSEQSERRQERDHKAAMAEAIHRRIQELLAHIEAVGPFDREKFMESLRQFREQIRSSEGAEREKALRKHDELAVIGLEGRAIAQMLSAIGAQNLALDYNERTVFSLTPTPMQLLLPGNDWADLVSDLVEQRSGQGAVFAIAPRDGIGTFRVEGRMAERATQDRVPAGLLLAVHRMGAALRMNCTFRVVNAAGETIASGSSMFDFESEAESSDGEHQGDPLSLSQTGKEAAQIFDGTVPVGGVTGIVAGRIEITGGATVPTQGVDAAVTVTVVWPRAPHDTTELSDAWRARLADPTGYEPLSLVGEALALATEGNYAALLPDALLPKTARLFAAPVSVSRLRSALKQWGMVESQSDGWTIIKPADPFTVRLGRTDRRALAPLTRLVVQAANIRLGALAEYSLDAPKAERDELLDLRLIYLLNPNAATPQFWQVHGEREAMMMFAQLSQAELRALQQPDAVVPVPVGRFVHFDQRPAFDLVFNSLDGPSFSRRVANVHPERTEALPRGIPRNAYLEVSASNDTAILGRDSVTGEEAVLSIRELAQRKAMYDHPNTHDHAQPVPSFDSYSIATQTDYTLLLRLAEGILQRRTLADYAVTDPASRLTWQQLPESVQSEYEEAYKRAYERSSHIRIGEGRQPVIPPE